MISPLKGNWEETSFIIPPPKKKCFYVKQGGTKQFTFSAHRCKSCHFFQMQKSSFSFLVPSIQPHTFHLHLAILCPSARVLHHMEETKEASSNKLRRQNTSSFNRFFFFFLKKKNKKLACQSSNPSAFYSPRSYLFPPPHLFRRALWRRRRTHKARPHFLPLVRVSIRPRERRLEGRIGGDIQSQLQGQRTQRRRGETDRAWNSMVTWDFDTHPRGSALNELLNFACVCVRTYIYVDTCIKI